MHHFPGYHLSDQVFESPKAVFFRGLRNHDQLPVFMKIMKSPFPSFIDKANFKNEYEVSKHLELKGSLKPISFEADRNRYALVFEDFAGVPPNPATFFDEFGVSGFLKFAVEVTGVVNDFHQKGVIHRNLKPANLLLDPSLSQIKIMGFLVTSLREEFTNDEQFQNLIGALAYASPEQTGRLNRDIDHCSDFYSLGISFYELLTQAPPFKASDPMELVHCHIARSPEPPDVRNPKVPMMISRIVLKLLNKTPEDRYQSGFGLMSDLRRCLESWEQHGDIPLFTPGEQDVSHRFHIPRKLYGREPELKIMVDAFERVCHRGCLFQPIHGASGMGKSTLVEEIQKDITKRRGYFIAGKYEQNQHNVPYKAFIQAFQDLIRQILSESPAEVRHWREELLEALGGNGQVIVDVIPKVELIIGAQPPLPMVGAAEAQNRFRLTFTRFLNVFARKEHPLTLFLDDIHWAGESSLALVKTLLSEDAGRYLFIIGAWRTEEVSIDHPLMGMLTDLETRGSCLPGIELQPLDLIHIQELLRDALGQGPDASRALAEVLLKKSEGNPLFIGVFLKSLYDEGLIVFNASRGRWEWDAALIKSHKSSGHNLMEMMAARLSKLSEDTRGVLKLAACIGNRFSLRMLSIATQTSQADTAASLMEAVNEGLVAPVGDTYHLLEVYDPAELDALRDLEISYQFRHDRIQQAVYNLMNNDQSKETHLKVGQRLLEHSGVHALDDHIFNIVNQLNYGREFIETAEERGQLARLNLTAGLKAKQSIAYQHAQQYLLTGLNLLPENPFKTDYELTFQIYLNLAEAEYYTRNPDESMKLFDKILANTASLRDKALVYETRVLILNNLSSLEEAVRVGLEGLALFGLQVPESREEMSQNADTMVEEIRAYLADQEVDTILNLPAAQDEAALEYDRLLAYLIPPAFNTDPVLFRLLTSIQMKHTIKNGHSPTSAYAYATFGILLGSLNDFKLGFDLGQLALRLNLQYPDPVVKYKLDFIGCDLLNHWRRHIRHDIPTLEATYRKALEYGDLVYANYTILVISHNRWVLEEPLLSMLDESERHLTFANQTRNRAVAESQRLVSHAILNLRGLTHQADSLESEGFQEHTCLAQLESSHYMTGVSAFHIYKMEILYLRGFYEAAYERALLSEQFITYSQNTLTYSNHYFFMGLAIAAIAERHPQREDLLVQLRQIRDRINSWAANCPENFLHKFHLIGAELDRLEGHNFEAMNHYQEAIHSAEDQGFMKSLAIAHELAGRFYLARQFTPFAEHHLRAAIAGYEEWGATAKVSDLKHGHGDFLKSIEQGRHSPTPRQEQGDYSRVLDMSTLLKAAQAISGEIMIDQLLRKMMRIVIENAGAQRGILLLQDPGGLIIKAECRVDDAQVSLPEDEYLDAREDLAKPVIHYVYRTKSDLVIADVARDKSFVGDAYLADSGVKAVLCVPILSRTEILGILYLENHLARDAFSDDRLELLNMLAPQIAISLQNAHVMTDLGRLNRSLKDEIEQKHQAEKALQKAQKIALTNAHNEGKARFASSVLHNINNVLNSVGLACEGIDETLKHSRLVNLGKSVKMIDKNLENLGEYLSEDPRGKLLPNYLVQLNETLNDEHTTMKSEMVGLTRNVKLMKDIIQTQQASAKGALRAEALDLLLLIEDALSIQSDAINRHRVEVIRDFTVDDPVKAQKAQLTHILINLFKNAVEAMGHAQERRLTLTTGRTDDDLIYLDVADSGAGISGEAMKSMFTHGFTTKEDGHGFGLAYCAKVMKEMDGVIDVRSEGVGQGATFRLTFGKPEY